MNFSERVVSTLGSRRFSLLILKIGILYFLLLTLLWIMDLIPPSPWMVWGPAFLWFVFFLINLTISLLTRKYIFRGNLLFHIAFLLVAGGVVVSALFRFSGSAVVLEGESFWGGEGEYTRPPSYGLLVDTPPVVSFLLKKVTPGYWRDELYFVRLDALIRYPAWDPEGEATVRLNGGPRIGGARLRLKGFGLFPVIRVEQGGRLLFDGPVRALVFPPGNEDAVEIGSYRFHIRLFPDAVVEGERVRNGGMEPKNPLLLVRVEWLGRELFNGPLDVNGTLRAGDLLLTFKGVKEWVEFGVVRDPGEWFVFFGFLLAIAGLLWRMAHTLPGKKGGERPSRFSRPLLVFLLLVEGLYIGKRWASTGHPPILGTFEEALSSSFTVLLFALLFDRAGRFTLPAIILALTTLLYGFNFDSTERPLVISEQSYWVYFHALFAWIAYGFYTFSTMAALAIRLARGRGSSGMRYTVSMMERGLLNGLFVQTVMFILGSYYSSRLHGSWWMWDPVEYLFVISWFLYAIPLHGRVFFGWGRERMALWILIASAGTILLYWGLIYFPWATYHVFDPQWKTHTLP